MIEWIEGAIAAFESLGTLGCVLFVAAYIAGALLLLPEALFTIAAILPGTFVYAFLGATGRALMGGGDPLKWAMLAIGIIATIVLSIFLGRLAKKRLRIDG